MLQKLLAASLVLACSVEGFSQELAVTPQTTTPVTSQVLSAADPEPEKKSSTTVTGSVDVYYRYDFSKTRYNNLTSFTNSHNSFELGMASLKVEHKMGKVSGVADLGFGKRAREFAYNDEGIVQAVKQLYVSYAATEWLKFTMGTWATHVGYELVDPQLNRNYSMSYMFTNGPFTHTGLKADITRGKHGFMVGVSNPTDYRSVPDGMINKKFLIAQYSIAPTDNFKAYLNYVGGQAPDSTKTNQFDVVLTQKVSDKFSLGVNGTVNTSKFKDNGKYTDGQSWWGSALYLNLDPTPAFGLTLRTEYFSDQKQLKMFGPAVDGGSIFATTLSANFRVASFILIPEFRVDNASEKIFVDKNGGAKSATGSFLLAAIYYL